MSTLAREELLWKFGKAEVPEVEARRQHILKVLLEASPQTRHELIDEGPVEGRLSEARDALRQVLVQRQLTPSKDEDARIEACADLVTLKMSCRVTVVDVKVALIRLAIASLVMSMGCGSSQTNAPVPATGTAPTTAATGSAPTDHPTTDSTAANKGSLSGSGPTTQTCPPTFAAAPITCVTSIHCEYPEGQCNCAPQAVCHGGARMPPPPRTPPPPPPLVWKCTPTPPAVRPDGCPGVRPSEGSCTVENKRCEYPDVCFAGTTAICIDGRWLLTPWPPPP